MEKNAETSKRKSRIICPDTVITSSIKVAPLTRRLMKTLSALMGVPIIHRGKSNLDEIAYYVKRAGFRSFVVFFSRGDKPSLLSFYKLTEKGFFVRYGCIVLSNVIFHRRPRLYIGFNIISEDSEALAEKIWDFIIGIFGEDSCESFRGRICNSIIKNAGDKGVIEFWDKRKILTLEVKKVVISREK